MKTSLLVLVSLSAVLLACSAEDELSSIWGIDYSAETASAFAMGSVNQYNGESKSIYIVKNASMRCTGGDAFSLHYLFENGETLEIQLVKKTVDYNYTFPGSEGSNLLLSVQFNGEKLNLKESKVTIQPRTAENKLATLTKVYTLDKGVFDGAIGRVPLLK